jgi:hypothetical protein
MCKFAYDRKNLKIFMWIGSKYYEKMKKKKTWLLDIKKSEWNLNKGN